MTLDELKQAAAEVKKQQALVKQEMKERGDKGQLWYNDMCAAWPDYVAAISAQAERRHLCRTGQEK